VLSLRYPVRVASRVRLKPLEGVRWVFLREELVNLTFDTLFSEFIQNANLVVAYFVYVRIAPLSLSLSRSRRQLNLQRGLDAKEKNRAYPQLFVFFF